MRLAILALAVVLDHGPAAAECGAAARYAFVPAGEGVIRVDTETGQVARCADAGVAARPLVSQERAGDDEVARLEARIAALEAHVAMLQGGAAGTAPGDQPLARVAALAERMMGRLFSLVRGMKRHPDDAGA